LDHIRTGGDPFEFGRSRPLDFGHWSAHKLETMSDYAISHGESVAAGILLDSRYALQQGWIEASALEALAGAMLAAGLRPFDERMMARDARGRLRILEGLEEFREHLGGELCLTFPDGIGRSRNEHRVDEAEIEAALCWVRDYCQA